MRICYEKGFIEMDNECFKNVTKRGLHMVFDGSILK